MSANLTDLIPLRSDNRPKNDLPVQAPEFDLTQVAKKLVLAIPVFTAALVIALKAFGVKEATDPAYVGAALGVTAVGLLTLGIVAAADILGRAYVAAGAASAKGDSASSVKEDTTTAAAEATKQPNEKLDAAAQKQRDARDREAEAERKRLDRVAEEERQRLDRVAHDERERQDRVAEEERKRLAQVAEDELRWKAQVAKTAGDTSSGG